MAEQKHTHNSNASKSDHTSKTTTDHEVIREWAEDRGAKPACVKHTGGKSDVGLLRLDFPGYSGADSLEHIEWDEFFDKFEESNLALVYQEETAEGKKSNFNKFVSRHEEEKTSSKSTSAQPTAAKAGSSKTAAAKSSAKPKTSKAAKH